MSWKENLKQRKYGEHKHCIACGRAVPLSQDFCSVECKDTYGKADKKSSRKGIWQFVMIGAVMVVSLVILPMFQ